MKAILITGSPGSGKTTVSNALSERFRETGVHHVVIDPDEIARIFPENSLSQLKFEGLSKLYPLYVKSNVDFVIIPITIDNDSDLEQLHRISGKDSIVVFNLVVDENTLLERVVEREQNEFWQNKLYKLVKAYAQNSNARSFHGNDINANNISIINLVDEITCLLG